MNNQPISDNVNTLQAKVKALTNDLSFNMKLVGHYCNKYDDLAFRYGRNLVEMDSLRQKVLNQQKELTNLKAVYEGSKYDLDPPKPRRVRNRKPRAIKDEPIMDAPYIPFNSADDTANPTS